MAWSDPTLDEARTTRSAVIGARGLSDPLSPLRRPVFGLFWGASLISNLGTNIQAVAAAWMMTSLTTSEEMVALVHTASTLPVMIFSLLAGSIADNRNRRAVMLTAQTFMLVCSAVLVGFTHFELITPWLLLFFTFAVACGTAFYNPSWQVSVGEMVPRAEVPKAVALNIMGFNISRSLGPAFGGLIVAALGAGIAFALNTATYVVLIGMLLSWRSPVPAPGFSGEGLLRGVRTGFRYAAHSQDILNVLRRAFVFGIAASSVFALLPLFARDLVNAGAVDYGFMLGAFGVGAVSGALVVGPLRGWMCGETLVRVVFAVFALAILATAVSWNSWQICGAMFVCGSCWITALTTFNVTTQLSSPRWIVGRMISCYHSCVFGGMALGSWLWGVIAQTQGVPVAMAVAAASFVLGILLGLRNPLPQPPECEITHVEWTAPPLAVDAGSMNGSIVITIDYRIASANEDAFLSAMAERRRFQRRNGAEGWSLMRDLQDPEVWRESFHTASWPDYVRHNLRGTHADAAVTDYIYELHCGDYPPVIRCMQMREAVASRQSGGR